MLDLQIKKALRKQRAENKVDLAGRQELVISTLREQMRKTRGTPFIQGLLAALPIPSAHGWTENEIRQDDEACDQAIEAAMKAFGEKVKAEHKEKLSKEINRLTAEFESKTQEVDNGWS